jgi:plasmid stability protein
MTELLIRDISDAVITQLKRKADLAGVSVEEEVRRMLEAATVADKAEAAARLDAVRQSIGVLHGVSTTDVLREDRDAR